MHSDENSNFPHIIHFVDGNSEHIWLEKFIHYLNIRGYSQSLLTVEPSGELHREFSTKFPNLQVVNSKRVNAKIFSAIKNLTKQSNSNKNVIVFAMGHRTGFVSGLVSLFLPISFVLSHTQQPKYFKIMMRSSKLKGWIHQGAYRFYLRRADLVLSFSMEVRNELTRLKLKERKILGVSFGIDIEPLKRELAENVTHRNMTQDNHSRVLMVGRLAPEKSYSLAFHAFAGFLQVDPTAILTVAGVGPQKDYLENLTKTLGINRNVRFLGFVENIPRLMLDSDVLLHLSETESFGQIYIEALICSLPVICTQTGVAIDFHEQSQGNFYLLHHETPESVCAELIKFFSNNRMTSPRTQGITELVEKHSDSFVFSRLDEAFNSLKHQK